MAKCDQVSLYFINHRLCLAAQCLYSIYHRLSKTPLDGMTVLYPVELRLYSILRRLYRIIGTPSTYFIKEYGQREMNPPQMNNYSENPI